MNMNLNIMFRVSQFTTKYAIYNQCVTHLYHLIPSVMGFPLPHSVGVTICRQVRRRYDVNRVRFAVQRMRPNWVPTMFV
jgi:hypothetical protein